MNLVHIRFASILTFAFATAACSSDEGGTTNPGSGGGAGANSGGATSTGGANSGGAASGGTTASGGQSSGGATSSGGTSGGSGGSGSGSGGSSGGSGGGAGGSIADCPAPPADASQAAVTALNAVNTLRVAMGIPCMELIPELSVAAQLHCDYYAANLGNDACANGHTEVAGCEGFVAASPGDRIAAAGYSGNGWSEVMAFQNDPEGAIDMWINSAFHRTPLLSPWYRHMGYGGAEECDTIDLGRGPQTPDDVTAIYPYPGQTGLPTAFRGDREGPTPRTPVTTNEWPSSTPIHVYAQDYQIETYQIMVDGQTTPLATTLANAEYDDLIQNPFIFYADAPFASQTTYRVQVSGSQGGIPLAFDWTFTTE